MKDIEPELKFKFWGGKKIEAVFDEPEMIMPAPDPFPRRPASH